MIPIKLKAKTPTRLVLSGLLVALFTTAPGALATSPEALPHGDEVAARINARSEGEHVSRKLTITMTDKRGKQRVRETMGFRKYYADEKRTVIYYLSPKNVRDTAFLTYDYTAREREDNQWLYLPALRKVRRIAAADRGDYFLGTDMTYEDIKLETRVSTDDFSFKTLGPCENGGQTGLLIEGTPRSEEIARELGYGRSQSCVDTEIWMVRQTVFWDVQGNPLKTVVTEAIEQIDDIWTQLRMVVTNHKTGHRTELVFSEVDYRAPVDDSIFTTAAIKRGL